MNAWDGGDFYELVKRIERRSNGRQTNINIKFNQETADSFGMYISSNPTVYILNILLRIADRLGEIPSH